MDSRKLYTFFSKKKEINSPVCSKNQTTQLLSDAPNDVKSVITNFMPDYEQIKMAKVNKAFHRYIKSKSTNKPCFYYAVGSNIDIYNHYGYFIRKQYISKQEIVSSLKKNSVLFCDYHTAKKYAYLRRINFYDQELDFFMPLEIPSVFVVQLINDGVYNKISTTVRITEHIPDCPAPPAATTMVASGFKTSPHNVKIYFSHFNGSLLQHYTSNSRFSTIWSQALSAHNDLQQSVMAGVLALFNSYFTCYSNFTRHNQALVTQVLDKALQNPSIEDLHNFMVSAYQDGISNNTINKSGHYMQMLDFVNSQLNILKNLNQLPEIKDYISRHGIDR